MNTGFVYHLENMHWQFFGTLTFKSESLPQYRRMTMYFMLMRITAKRYHVHFKRLLWCLRQEQGELGGREHFHFLLAGLPESRLTNYTTAAFVLMNDWEQCGGGIARVRRYDYTRKGVAYLTKDLGTLGANRYELSKFKRETADLTLSDGLVRWLGLRRK